MNPLPQKIQMSSTGAGLFKVWGLLLAAVTLVGCAEAQFLASSAKRVQSASDGGKYLGAYKVGNPYQIKGAWYYPNEDWAYDETGIASWYGPQFHLKKTANGEIFDMNLLTAAHKTLQMPSMVRVINLENGRSVQLRLNDRGPFAKGRIIDVSRRAAQLLGFEKQGTARVRVQIMADESRAMKAAILSGKQLAEQGSPISQASADGLAKPNVSAEALPPPPGTQAAAAPIQAEPLNAAPRGQPLVSAADLAAVNRPTSAEQAAIVPDEVVEQFPTTTTRLFVQAGAFTNYENALKTKLNLGRVGEAEISHVLVNERDFYRVRVGPLSEVARADQLLERVQQLGFGGARIIVEKAAGS